MSGEIKILLYILIGIGYLFSKMYRRELKNQKEKSINKRPNSNKKIEDIFKELQKTLNLPDFSESKPVQKKKAVLAEKQVKPMFVEGGSKSRLKYYKPIQPSSLKKDSASIEEHYQQEKEGSVYSRQMDIDPRQAMIYSEIIKKPQY